MQAGKILSIFGWLTKNKQTCTPVTKYENNTWFHYEEKSTTAIVFVHGLLSSADSCWRAKAGTFWPQIVKEDSNFNGASIYLAGYHTTPTSGKYDIAQCALELSGALFTEGVNRRAPIAFPRILFITHSLGGIVTRRMLEQNVLRFRHCELGLVLMASPSLGSGYAKALARLANLYGHKVAAELLPESDSLKDIDDRFRAARDDGRFSSLVGAEAVEHKGLATSRFLPQIFPPIVDGRSASRYFGAERIIADTDHFSIVKPDGPNSPSHQFLVQFIQSKFPMTAPSNESLNETEGGERLSPVLTDRRCEPDPLFEIYNSEHSEFYIERDEDATFERHLKYASVWLHGASGVGKTSLVRRYLSRRGLHPAEMTLSHLRAGATREALLAEICDCLLALKSSTGRATVAPSIEAIAALCGSEAIPLFLDELPITQDSAALIEAIGSLADHLKRHWRADARLIVCSIGQPEPSLMLGRMREQFATISLEPWNESSIARLLEKISNSSPTRALSVEQAQILIGKAEGSPRFVKALFRLCEARNVPIEGVHLTGLIEETKRSLG